MMYLQSVIPHTVPGNDDQRREGAWDSAARQAHGESPPPVDEERPQELMGAGAHGDGQGATGPLPAFDDLDFSLGNLPHADSDVRVAMAVLMRIV